MKLSCEICCVEPQENRNNKITQRKIFAFTQEILFNDNLNNSKNERIDEKQKTKDSSMMKNVRNHSIYL